jgi:hypothetical protein
MIMKKEIKMVSNTWFEVKEFFVTIGETVSHIATQVWARL